MDKGIDVKDQVVGKVEESGKGSDKFEKNKEKVVENHEQWM